MYTRLKPYISKQSVESLYEGSKKASFESVVRTSNSKKASLGALYEGSIDQKDKA